MSNREYEIFNITLVFIGNFNPSILHPEWLVHRKLIRESDVLDDSVEIIHPDFTRINLKWCTLEIKKSRFEFKTMEEPYVEPLKDLAISIFNILGETPVNSFGINYLLHYTLSSYDRYEQLGFKLSPVNKLFDFLEKPKLLDISIVEGYEKYSESGRFTIKILPSDIIRDNKSIVVRINHHFEVLNQRNGKSAADQLSQNWSRSFSTVKIMMEKLWHNLE